MNHKSVLIIAVLICMSGADKPMSSGVVKALRAYEDSVRSANEQKLRSLQVAEDEFLQGLKESLDAALASKDLKAANEIDAAIKAIARKKTAPIPTSEFAINACRKRDDLVQAANDAHLESLNTAEEAYLNGLQGGLEAAIAAKDLLEANRIDAAIKEMRAAIDARNVTDIHAESALGFVIETWASGLGDIRGVTVGPDDVFGRHPFVYSVTRRAILRIPAKGRIEPFAEGFKAERTGRIVFGNGESAAFGRDMFVTMPADQGKVADLVMRVTPNGMTSLFHSGPKSMAKGAAFGTGGRFGDFLYVVNPGDKGLYRIDASSEGSRLGADVSSESWEDDMIFTTGGEFGENAYLTDGVHGKLLRLNNAGSVTAFANVPGAMSIAQGEGTFGDFLYVGTFDGNVFRISPSGDVVPFLTGFGTHSPEGNFRGIDVEDDQMWLTTDTGDLLRVTLQASDAPPIVGEWQESPNVIFSVTQNGEKFTATTTYLHKSAGQIRAIVTGTISKEGKIIAEMEHTQCPASWSKWQSREGTLSPDGKTIRGRAEFKGGGHDFVWTLKP